MSWRLPGANSAARRYCFLVVAALEAGQIDRDWLPVDHVGNLQLRGVKLFVLRRGLGDDIALDNLRLRDRPRAQNLDLSQKEGRAHDGEKPANDEAGHADELKDAASFSAHKIIMTDCGGEGLDSRCDNYLKVSS